MAFTFKEFIRSLIPGYLIEKDSYKDSQGEGLFERYLVMFGEYLDDDVLVKIDSYLDITDPQICEERFLEHISDVLGNPPDVFNDIEIYRNLLSYIVSIYKIKGTKRAYELFFSLMGFAIEIEELPVLNIGSNYDQDSQYDVNPEDNLYDQNICQPCSYYIIRFYYVNDANEVLSLTTLGLLRAAIDFNEPINAKLKALVIVINLEDSIRLGVSDVEPEIELEIIPAYDVGHLYDADIEYKYDDWYLGSIGEMVAALNSIGGMDIGSPFYIFAESNEEYWTSTEKGINTAEFVSAFYNEGGTANKTAAKNIRPIRSFTDYEGAYDFTGIGPAGGAIFLIEAIPGSALHRYYEMGPSDLDVAKFSPDGILVGGTSIAIGSGLNNSILIENAILPTDYCAARTCLEYVMP